ncbi:exopolysaccharide biosynthesis protein [Jannaschia sp. 2305UL9-9]|uniref:exopolysaccharide biosynthesis protein n=1 Tax=Jannaschia sp. 2305UL9-9 TaxID=3121638 RepID=UPI0035273843
MTKPSEILDTLQGLADDQDDVDVGSILSKLGHRSTGAMLALPAALELTPIGGIPGVPTVLATIVAIFAVQILFGRDCLWLPGFLSRRSVSSDKMSTAVSKMRPAAKWADRHLGQHMLFLIDGVAHNIAALAVLAFCATVPVLELVPFASSIPTSVIVLFGVALLTRDGRVMAAAWVASALAVVGLVMLWP